jgi:inner membrane transporter RhtA
MSSQGLALRRPRRAEGGALMAVASMASVQLGLALSVHLFERLGPLGTAGLRLAWAGVLLLILVRPRLREFTGRDLLACCVLGVVTGTMTLLFMLAVARIPLGTATALEFLGPLAVSLHGGGRRRWAAMAAIGVALLTQPWHGGIDPAGLAFALGAGVGWGAYILLTQHVGDRITGLSGLAVSLPVAGAVAMLAAALASGPAGLGQATWPLLAIMVMLAALPGIPRPAPAHHQRLRHPDEPGTCLCAPGGSAAARAGPRRNTRRWHHPRGHRRDRRDPRRRARTRAAGLHDRERGCQRRARRFRLSAP